MLARERYKEIKQLIVKDKKVLISKLSEHFHVTEETIRRDLDKLQSEGIATKVCGGAVLNTERINESIAFYKRAYCNAEEKRAIVTKAVELIDEHMTIGTDSSSTALELMKLLEDRRDLTVFTNSSEALRVFSQSRVNMMSTGGVLNANSLSLQGSIAKLAIKNYNVDIAFISCKGVDLEKGILDAYEAEAELKQVLSDQASMVVLMIDHTKFNRRGFVKFIDFQDVDCIVTDCKPSQEWIELCHRYNIQLMY